VQAVSSMRHTLLYRLHEAYLETNASLPRGQTACHVQGLKARRAAKADLRLARLAKAPQIWRNHAVPGGHKGWHLIAPYVRGVREACLAAHDQSTSC